MLIILICVFALFYEVRVLLEILATDWFTVPAWAFTASTVCIGVSAGIVLLCSIGSALQGKRHLQALIGAVYLLAIGGMHTAFGLTISPIMKDWQLWSYVAAAGMAVITILLTISHFLHQRKRIKHKKTGAAGYKRRSSSGRRKVSTKKKRRK